jgi:hypothetical protein
MYISYLYEAIYISHVISLEKKGLECGLSRPLFSLYFTITYSKTDVTSGRLSGSAMQPKRAHAGPLLLGLNTKTS